MWAALRFYWDISRGYRLRPWASPYIRWRMETYFGPEAAILDREQFLALLWSERRQLLRFAKWAAERRRAQRR